jgi:RNA polymerase sigma-70 factor (ECF subfamily)
MEQVDQEAEVGGPHALSQPEQELLYKEIDSLLCSAVHGETAERDRTIFWLYYRTGLTTAAIAGLPSFNMNPKSVQSVIYRLTQILRNELSPAETGSPPKTLGMNPSL